MPNLDDFIMLPNGIKSNFQYSEFVESEIALRKNIANIPSDKDWKSIERLVINILQPIRYKFGGIRITSGFRSVELCEAVGSDKNSNHTRGEAADIKPINYQVSLLSILTWIEANLTYRELIAEFFPTGWVHVAYREKDSAKILKLKDGNHHYSKVDINYISGIYSNTMKA